MNSHYAYIVQIVALCTTCPVYSMFMRGDEPKIITTNTPTQEKPTYPCGREKKEGDLSCFELGNIVDTYIYQSLNDVQKKDTIVRNIATYPDLTPCGRFKPGNVSSCASLEKIFKEYENNYRKSIIDSKNNIVQEACTRLRRQEEKTCYHVSVLYYAAQREIKEFKTNIETGIITHDHYNDSVQKYKNQKEAIKLLECGGFRFHDKESANCQTLECLMESLVIEKKALELYRKQFTNPSTN